MRPGYKTVAILLTLTGIAHAGKLSQAEKKLDAANQAAQRHHAAAAAASRAARIAQRNQAALVAQEITTAAALRGTEDRTARIAAKLTNLTHRTEAARAELQADAAAIAPLLPLIGRLALHPAATLLAADAAPGHAAEGALIMRGLTHEIAARAAALRTAQARYASLTTDLTARQTEMTRAIATQQNSEQALQADIAAVQQQAAGAILRHTAEAAAAARAAANAHDLVGVITRLQRQHRRAAQARAQARALAAAARITVPALPHALRHAPVAGVLVHGFGASTAAGPATGDTFAAAPGAVVSAACSGRVVFARPFQSYGRLLILDCGGGYDFVMAGFDKFDVGVGQSVRAGQPVGAMPGYAPHDPGRQPRLYVELRDRGSPIDPAGHYAGARTGP